ncbi:MAG: acyl-phosphate glycerol 3-phosphate acyltransferase, partial [Lysobacterales bacterium CG_4_9_14_3_um_filter_62_6]
MTGVMVAKILMAYLLGSLSGSLLLGRWRHVDIRALGSGNAGGTNAFRTQGWRFGLSVALFDIGKGALAVWIGQRGVIDPALALRLGMACGAGAGLGHVWPLYFGFRGGKGAATL